MNATPLPWLAPALRALGATQGHAILVHGPRGVGQFELGLELARAWLCEAEPPLRPCGQCASCRLVAARSHPDLLVLLPQALREALGWAALDEDEADKSAKTKPSKEIRVDAVRALVAFAQTTSARGRAKVAVIHPAERMNAVAANTLLKTLEEPPGNARFVLCTAAPDALLPTVRSRCHAFAVGPPETHLAVSWLAAQGVSQPEVALRAAGGQPVDALDAAADGLDAALWLRLPELVRNGEAGKLAGLPLPRLVDALQKLCHDLLRRAVGAEARFFAPAALPAPTDADAMLDWARALGAAARHAEHPWHVALAAEALILQGTRALNGRGTPSQERVWLHSAA
jgi:DNA polymerase III subunit delta'